MYILNVFVWSCFFVVFLPLEVCAQKKNRTYTKVTNIESLYPFWSPDGQQIVFQSNFFGNYDIYLMAADGSDKQRLTTEGSNNKNPSFSPDGKTIAFVSDRSGNEEIWLMDANGMNQRQLTNHPARDIHPYWHPDGDRILFNSERFGGEYLNVLEIHIVNKTINVLTKRE